MSDGFAYLDILFFAMVAAFIAFRLRNVLGRKTGHERPRRTRSASVPRTAATTMSCRCRSAARTPPGDAAVPPVADGPAAAGVAAIRRADPRFDPDQFLQGAGLRSR